MAKKRDLKGGLVYSSGHGRMCPGCNHPEEECICNKKRSVRNGDGVVRVRRESKGRGGKTVSVISGVALDEGGLSQLAADLKRTIGTGGSVRDGDIEIQGDKVERIMAVLKTRGYTVKRSGG